jgi:uncharacterized protein (TIGR03382 family)
MKSFVIPGAAMAAAISLFAGSAHAFVPWANDNGAATNFTWANGGSDTGLFGSPILVGGDTFVFFPSGFRAESSGGVAGAASDRLQFDLFANANFAFTDIRVVEYGDYGIFGEGLVAVAGALTATDLIGGGSATDALVSTPGGPITMPGFGNWTASAGVDATGTRALRIELRNDLIAITFGNSAAFIEKKVLGSAVGIQIIPAPGAVALMGFAGLVATRRRR